MRTAKLSTSPSSAAMSSLRRLKTAFSPMSPTSPSESSHSSSSTSPLSASLSASSSFSRASFSDFSLSPQRSWSVTKVSHRAIRRKKSCVELEQEEERVTISTNLVSLVEPRPRLIGSVQGSIEEVLSGKV
ncbi:hypothetical protein K431DRAFT_40025 [Polychaeton citri CBS 116435]|uniref:Uncharacterized protein n=1 Tax=Polychaeton citri CBS 116435 TaxID=1314669 RepID=A0A9P4QBR9_9PEZI|nr:hypothetical protein K431DRAFT_40025 [Polychaeton citri CBS 116435]